MWICDGKRGPGKGRRVLFAVVVVVVVAMVVESCNSPFVACV